MKFKHKTDKSLESFPVFPYVAWGVTIGFAVFVYNIAVDLQQTAEQLKAQTEALELQTKSDITEIDLEAYSNQ